MGNEITKKPPESPKRLLIQPKPLPKPMPKPMPKTTMVPVAIKQRRPPQNSYSMISDRRMQSMHTTQTVTTPRTFSPPNFMQPRTLPRSANTNFMQPKMHTPVFNGNLLGNTGSSGFHQPVVSAPIPPPNVPYDVHFQMLANQSGTPIIVTSPVNVNRNPGSLVPTRLGRPSQFINRVEPSNPTPVIPKPREYGVKSEGKYIYGRRRPITDEDLYWLCFFYSPQVPCRNGETCAWRHYDWVKKRDEITKWTPALAMKKHPSPNELRQVRLNKSRYYWLEENGSSNNRRPPPPRIIQDDLKDVHNPRPPIVFNSVTRTVKILDEEAKKDDEDIEEKKNEDEEKQETIDNDHITPKDDKKIENDGAKEAEKKDNIEETNKKIDDSQQKIDNVVAEKEESTKKVDDVKEKEKKDIVAEEEESNKKVDDSVQEKKDDIREEASDERTDNEDEDMDNDEIKAKDMSAKKKDNEPIKTTPTTQVTKKKPTQAKDKSDTATKGTAVLKKKDKKNPYLDFNFLATMNVDIKGDIKKIEELKPDQVNKAKQKMEEKPQRKKVTGGRRKGKKKSNIDESLITKPIATKQVAVDDNKGDDGTKVATTEKTKKEIEKKATSTNNDDGVPEDDDLAASGKGKQIPQVMGMSQIMGHLENIRILLQKSKDKDGHSKELELIEEAKSILSGVKLKL